MSSGPQGSFAPGPANSLGGLVYSIASYINYTYTTTTYSMYKSILIKITIYIGNRVSVYMNLRLQLNSWPL
jgi:hypothetical protein